MATVTVTATPGISKEPSTIHFDPLYLKTMNGMLKAGEALSSLIGFICIQSIYAAAYVSAGGWYSFVSMTAFWVCLILLLLYIFHIVEKLHGLPWLLSETIFSGVWTVFFFIAGCVSAAHGGQDPGWGAAAFFAFLCMVIFGYETFLKYTGWKRGDLAQGERASSPNVETPSIGPSYPTY